MGTEQSIMSDQRIGRYEIKAEQGRGGMATVYLAYDPRFGREVAIKVLPQQFLHDPLFRERFDREAHTIAALEHAAIVPVYDFGEDASQPYLVMRYMTGGSLAGKLNNGPMSIAESAAIMTRVSAALDEAHKRGIIHRDLKPGNILFDQYGDAFLSDFGIAKLTEATAALTGSTVIGTPAYMSPEQARGESGVDGRSDIYSLGVILFEMLTGQAPYEADTPMGVAIKHILDPVPRILSVNPELPTDIEGVIGRAMAKDPNQRFQSAGEMAAILTMVAMGQSLPDEYAVAPNPLTIPLRPGEAKEALPENAPTINPVSPVASAPTPQPAPKPAAPPIPPMPNLAPMTAEEERRYARDRERITKIELRAVEERAKADERIAKAEAYAAERKAYGKHKAKGGFHFNPVFFGCMLIFLLIFFAGVGGFFGILKGIAGTFTSMSLPPNFVFSEESAGPPLQTYTLEEKVGNIETLEVTLDLTAIDTELGVLDSDDSDMLFIGEYERGEELSYTFTAPDTTASLDIREPEDREMHADKGSIDLLFNPNVAIDLTVIVGAGNAEIDLTGLNITSLNVEGGAGSLDIILPSNSQNLDVSVSSGAGTISIEPPEDTSALDLSRIDIQSAIGAVDLTLPENGDYDVKVSSGIGGVIIRVPELLEARINFDNGFANMPEPPERFEPLSDNETEWQTAGYVGAENRANITIEAGAGSVQIKD